MTPGRRVRINLVEYTDGPNARKLAIRYETCDGGEPEVEQFAITMSELIELSMTLARYIASLVPRP